ncbi:Gfo/Idh/MocA family oxidoreductase [Roseiconus lacunae]|uniref:Gfo/Idh/MocA family oxidoreductase n=1 Tax=Roseiconus lacunae TaxID=2605694 RepID=UPI00309118B2|nr:Gfo/Idh/MocA family oxidoreductase [Stieleria sp. HD01]
MQERIEASDTDAPNTSDKSNRRDFLVKGSAVASGIGASALHVPAVHSAEAAAANSELVRIGIVGLGGRGSGALNDNLTINDNVQLVATADVDPAKHKGILPRLKKTYGDKIAVDAGKNFVGLDAYKRILDDPEIDLVLMTTPPGFRPKYVLEAVQAGKHVFAEKPSCVDPAGYRTCLVAHELAKQSGTAIVTGTQYRRQVNYMEAIQKIHEGAIGDIINMTARYCSTGIWYRARKEGMTDTQYQVYNWMHFIWLSGDQIAEQAVHNVDVMNWVMGGPPEQAYAGGGRFTRPDDSEMWDNMSVDFTYPGDRQVSFKCRQIRGTQSEVGNRIYGSNGTATILGSNGGAMIYDKDGNEVWSMKGNIQAAYKQEHKDLVDSIRAGEPIVELKQTADSSMTAVLGRMAAYTGQKVDWKFATEESELDLFPESLSFDNDLPEPSFAVPGQTKLT